MWGRHTGRFWRALLALAILIGALFAIHHGVAWWIVTIALVAIAVLWSILELGKLPPICRRIFDALGVVDASHFRIFSRSAPSYRYVDLFRACDAWAEERAEGLVRLDLACSSPLGALLSGQLPSNELAEGQSAPSQPFPVAPDTHDYLPLGRFWAFSERAGRPAICVRLRHLAEGCFLEVASPDASYAPEVLDTIVEISTSRSIFRGAVVLADTSTRIVDYDDYALGTSGGALSLSFAAREPVSEEDIVLDDDVREVLHRNVVDLQNRADRLLRHGIPVKRGVLFHGPPGTGKTYACRYLYGQLEHSTVVVAAGNALLRVRELFELARSLSPSLVVLEDVDLVFSKRDHNPYGGTLGTLMDELDGLRPEEHVGVILTTNAVDRVEDAIKDRPGRISQSVYFGAPSAELRRRYLRRYLRDRPLERVDLDRIVELSRGATHAFLKEWVHRALQLAVERAQREGELDLDTVCFEDALREMRMFAEGAERIIGFSAREGRSS